jgi:sugar O-acyltransferase (sialic acid O-acetyltransferase NeuD family)
MKKYFVEKYNASDDSFKITEINTLSGSYVESGTIIFSIESSKADIDIEAEESGYIYFDLSIGQIIDVGDFFFLISNEKIDNNIELIHDKKPKIHEGYIISKKALDLMEQNDLNPIDFKSKIIKETDVLELLRSKRNSLNIDMDLILNNSSKIPLIIIGAGGGAKMCIDLINESVDYEVVGLLDDNLSIGTIILGVPVIGDLNCIKHLLSNNFENFVIAFGVLEKRNKRFILYNNLKELGCKFPNIIHKRAIVEKSVQLGEGNVILAGANVGSCVKLGNLNYINNNALISHDCKIMNNVHVAPGAVLASSINVESHVLIGMNTTLFYGIKIGESSTILNGLIINNDIKNNIIQKSNN